MSLKNLDSLKNIISKTVDDYVVRKKGEKANKFLIEDFTKEKIYSKKKFINSNDMTDIELKKITTNFITDNYFKSSKSLEDFAIFCYESISHSLNEYSNKIKHLYANLEPDNLDKKIKVFLKGGNVLNAVFFKDIEYLPINLKSIIIEEYSQYFNPSDFDFEIIISTKLSKKEEFNDELYDKIYDDLSHLLYFLLNDIRNHFYRFNLDIFDYSKYNDILKRRMLNKLKDTINKSDYTNNMNFYLCKLVHDDLYVEEPCINDIRFQYEKQYDHIVQPIMNADGSQGNLVVTPKTFDNIPSEMINNYYISMNNSLDFISGSKRSKFFLARMKSLFNFYFMEEFKWSKQYKCCDFKKIGAELIDIVIYHKDSTDNHNIEMLDYLTINDHPVLTMKYNELLKELYNIIFINFNLPWYQTKSEKRLKRYFSFEIIKFFKLYKSNEFIIDLVRENINLILIKFDQMIESPSLVDYTNLSLVLNKDIKDQNSMVIQNLKFIFDLPNELITLYQKINNELSKTDKYDRFNILQNKKNMNKNFKIFLNNWKDNFIFMLKLIDNISIDNQLLKDSKVSIKRNKYLINYNNQIGGFNSCNSSNNTYVIPTIMNFFNKYDKKSISDDNLNIFIRLCNELITNILTPGYFKSMVNYGELPNPNIFTSNYTVSITFLAFLSFIVEYFLFTIVYQNLTLTNQGNIIKFKFNTLDNKRNSYQNIWRYSGSNNNQNLELKIYRKELDQHSINNLLNEFCLEIDRLYYRFIITIIFNLKLKTGKEMNQLKEQIFPKVNLRRKVKLTENMYEHIYPNWKQKIKDFTNIKETDLNNIILKSLESVTDHSSKIDNEYTPDATGFFSWMYLIPNRFIKTNNDTNMSLKFGSCITNTYLENYLLIRINEEPSNIGIGLESEVGKSLHGYWIKTQESLKKDGNDNSITHWFTIWKTSDKIFKIREVNGFRIHNLSKDNTGKIKPNINLKDDPKSMIKSLIYPIFDSYIAYCDKNSSYNDELNDKKIKLEKYFNGFKDVLNKSMN